MKTNSLAKFSLTIIAAMVLAACGSSGGSDSPSTNSTASTTAAQAAAKKAADEAAAAKKAADEAAAKEAAAKKAADEAAAKKVADEAAAKKAADEAAAKKAADEAAAALAAENSDRKADNAVLRPTPTGSDLLEKSSVGAKNVVKNDSNLTTNFSSKTDSTSNTPELMNVQSPDNELKTLVVGQVPDKNDGNKVKVAYLAGLENLSKAAPADGKLKLEAAAIKGKDDKATADVFVYTVEAGRKNYTENYGDDDPKSKLKVLNAKGKDASAGNALRKSKPDNTSIVGQMYGAKITDGSVAGATTEEKMNAPFTNKLYMNVQYGSLTSALHAQDISKLVDGVEVENTKIATKIAKYGYTGTEGTEDNYFYRLNENNMDVAGLKKLKNDNPNTVLKYDGHAVTYGIDSKWNGGDKANGGSVPTAIVAAETAAESGLISGTHVTAKINLNTNAVEGNLYNKWYDGALKGVKDVRLVDFTGSMSENGNIAGTSHNNINNTGGLFGASLNKEATEMGGVVSSNDHTAEGKWGAVFGAQLTGRETVPSAKPVTPADPVKPVEPEPSINSSGNVTR